MTEEDAQKEGGYTLEQFREVWQEINGEWNPAEIVWVYEFELVPGSHVIRPGHCHLCGSWKLFSTFGNLDVVECEDCGAIYNGQMELTSPSLHKEVRA